MFEIKFNIFFKWFSYIQSKLYVFFKFSFKVSE
jgi:hypothetical protein